MKELDNPVKEMYLYALDSYGYEDCKITIEEGETGEVFYDLEYYSTEEEQCDVVLSSDNESVATVETDEMTVKTSGSFKVNGVKTGNTFVTMQVKGYAMSEIIDVEVVPKVGVWMAEKEVTLFKGDTYQLKARNNYDNRSLKWSITSGTTYITLSTRGLVTAKEKGEATVKVTSYDGKYSDTCKIIVDDTSNWSVKITNTADIPQSDFTPGKKVTLSASASGLANGVDNTIYWKSSDVYVARVNAESGEVTAVSPGEAVITAYLSSSPAVIDTVRIKVDAPPVTCSQFFWGTWVRMDNGKSYIIDETSLTLDGVKQKITSANDSSIIVNGIGELKKDKDNSDKILIWYDSVNEIDIPFFRKGGANLEYKVRVVGFEDEIDRAAASSIKGKSGLKVNAHSDNYSSYSDEGVTDTEGWVTLIAPVQGDTQTIQIEAEDSLIVVPGLKIENNGDKMGTIPLVKKDEYSLKITGTVKEESKTSGYMYGNNYKKYPLELTITNISNIKSETAVASISCTDPNVTIEVVDSKFKLDEITIQSMKANQTRTINLEVSYGTLASTYKDVELIVQIQNLATERVWNDYVPLRFFAGDMPITINTEEAAEENLNAALNGFLIYPDGNSKFFTVPARTSKTLYVPVFGPAKEYTMVFCGATVTGDLDDGTEMFYTVACDSVTPMDVDLDLKKFYKYGEPNNKESDAFRVIEDFEAYLGDGDIDYYLITATSSSTVVHE
ncbi:MAG: Ig-like domain-containing protein [Treponema sp.]|nr:Ig-like domain-containing protein [Treponema sp.]